MVDFRIHIMAEIVDPADFAVLTDDPVFHGIRVGLARFYPFLFCGNGFFIVFGVHHAAEGIAGIRLEFFQAAAAENIPDGFIGIQKLLFLVRLVDKEAAGYMLAELLNQRNQLLDENAFGGLADSENCDGNGDVPGNRIRADPAREAMHDGTVRQLFIKDGSAALFSAVLHNFVHKH